MRASERSLQFAGGTLGGQRHICCAFFNSIDEERRVLRSFIRDGARINVERAIATGQLEVRPWQEAYLRGDCFTF